MMSEEVQHGNNVPTELRGWDWFQAQREHGEKATQDVTGLTSQELAYAFKRCFSTQSGKIVLDHLQRMQDNYRDFDPELGFYNGAAFGFWRSGQRSIVNYIRKMTDKTTKGEK